MLYFGERFLMDISYKTTCGNYGIYSKNTYLIGILLNGIIKLPDLPQDWRFTLSFSLSLCPNFDQSKYINIHFLRSIL